MDESMHPTQRNRPVRFAGKAPGLANDCEIASRMMQGDRSAVSQLLDRHMGRLYTYLLRRLGNGHEKAIDEIVAATFDEALKRIKPYASGEATVPMDLWLIGMAEKRLARMRPGSPPEKSARLDVSHTPGANAVDAEPASADKSDLARLRAAMSAIPARHRPVLAMAVFEQMSAGEIAQCLGVSPSAAMRRLRQALRQLNKALSRQEVE